MGCETVGARIKDTPLCTIRTEERTLVINDHGHIQTDDPIDPLAGSRIVLGEGQRGQMVNQLGRLVTGPLAGLPTLGLNYGPSTYRPLTTPSGISPLSPQEMRNIANRFRAYGVVVREDVSTPEIAIDVDRIGTQTLASQLLDGDYIRPECRALFDLSRSEYEVRVYCSQMIMMARPMMPVLPMRPPVQEGTKESLSVVLMRQGVEEISRITSFYNSLVTSPLERGIAWFFDSEPTGRTS